MAEIQPTNSKKPNLLIEAGYKVAGSFIMVIMFLWGAGILLFGKEDLPYVFIMPYIIGLLAMLIAAETIIRDLVKLLKKSNE